MIAATGKRRLAKTNRPGRPTGLNEDKNTNTMAMHEPPPSSAETNDTPNTNFGRMEVVPLGYLLLGKRFSVDRKTRARITQAGNQFASNIVLQFFVLGAEASSLPVCNLSLSWLSYWVR